MSHTSIYNTPDHDLLREQVARFLARESAGVDGYLEQLDGRSPFRRPDA